MTSSITTVLLTGNLGYVGAVLTARLRDRGYTVVGYDMGYYCETALAPIPHPNRQIIKDIRAITPDDLGGVSGVIHLASLSNDSLGELSPELAEAINRDATIALAILAKKNGVRRFVFASSQSMYGIADVSQEVEEDNSEKKPLTVYARTKWEAECALKELNDDSFTVVSLRPSTVYGVSPFLRTDIVFNNLLASAHTTGRIEVKSNGEPWRPVVHVEDLSRAFIAALEAPQTLVGGEAFNVGEGNYTVRQLAQAAKRVVPGSTLVFTGEHGKDARTYRVSFAKIARVLGPFWQPQFDLDRGGKELVAFLTRIGFTEAMFRGPRTVRLKQIDRLQHENRLSQNLEWLSK